MVSLKTFTTGPMLLCTLAVLMFGLTKLSECRKETQFTNLGNPQHGLAKTSTFGKRNNKNDCDELGRMFIERGCAREDNRRCRLLAFRLDGGRLSKRPRCNFMPCELYDQPTSQSCESFCVGGNVTSGLCETGKVCCSKSFPPPPTVPPPKPQPKPRCAFSCKSSLSCRQATTGSCPYSHDVCCKDGNSFPKPDPYPQQNCAHQCVSGFDCAETDPYGSCGHYSLNVCCKKVGHQFFGGSNVGGGGVLQSSRGIFSDNFGQPLNYNGYSIFDNDPFHQGNPKTHPAPTPPRQPDQGSKVQTLPCAYTCLPRETCYDIDPTSNTKTCGSYTHVCCRVAKPLPVPTTPAPPPTTTKRMKKGDENRRGRKRKLPRFPTAAPKPASTTTTTTTTPATTKTTPARRKPYTLPYTVKPPTIRPVPRTTTTTTTTTTPTTNKRRGEAGQCPFECMRQAKCAEVDASFTCGARKVCCKTKKGDGA